MNKMILQLATLFLAGSANWVVAAQTATPIYQLSDVQGTFIQVPLTHDIYRYTRHSDLKDLRILDADQNSLPYEITAAPKSEKPESKIITDTLAFFPVAVDATPDTLRKLHTSQTKVQGDKVQIATSDRVLDNTTPEFYLIDISKIDHAITSLSVEWLAKPGNQYLEVELEATHNLQDWFSLGRATLAQLDQQDQRFKHNQINVDIAKKEYEFLRLKILRGADQLNISNIMAQQKIQVANETKAVSEIWSLVGEPAKDQTSIYVLDSRTKPPTVAAWEFIREEVTPAETLAIDLGSHIYGDGVKVFSRATKNSAWGLVYYGIWFNAQVGNKWQTSEPLGLNFNGDKFWRLELNESAKNYSPPKLVFSWQPTRLKIIANNKPHFSLAISKENGTGGSHQQVFNQIVSATSPTWVAASLIKLNVQPETVTSQKAEADWKQWLFWAALIAAVIVLLIFSLKLFKQLKLADTQQ
ncbi:MAG: DUF3999 family protein [Cellvibrio sp.]